MYLARHSLALVEAVAAAYEVVTRSDAVRSGAYERLWAALARFDFDEDHSRKLDEQLEKLRLEIHRLLRENETLKNADCRTCNGLGSVEGFLIGTRKQCSACLGRGVRG